MKIRLELLAKISLIFFIYVIINSFYVGLSKVPGEGDSLNYHIPLAKAYIDGTIFTPQFIDGEKFLRFSPGATQGILSLFYLLNIPPGLFNVLGVSFLFFSLIFLAKKNGWERNYGIIFATSISTLNGIVRWLDTQIIDIYLAAFFVLSLALLQKPEKKNSYFVKLGFCLGMLAGSKYSGILFACVLIIIYFKKIINFLNLKNFLVFSFLFLVLGMSWYIRNFLITGNPLYPQSSFLFKSGGLLILNHQVYSVAAGSMFGFFGTVNAFISEYMIWVLSIPITFLVLFKKMKDGLKFDQNLLLIILVGIINYFLFAFLPSDNIEHIMVSVVRYSYPAFIPFMVVTFAFFKKYRKEELLSVVALSNMFFVSFPFSYNPKLLFIFVPTALLIYFKYRS